MKHINRMHHNPHNQHQPHHYQHQQHHNTISNNNPNHTIHHNYPYHNESRGRDDEKYRNRTTTRRVDDSDNSTKHLTDESRQRHHPHLIYDTYSFDMNRLTELVLMIVTYAGGAGDDRLYRRAIQHGYTKEEIHHTIMLCNSLLITEGNVDLACLRTNNLTEHDMPSTFARAVSNILSHHNCAFFKKVDERVVSQTSYALDDLIRQAILQRDTNVLLDHVMSDNHMEHDLVLKIIDVCNYYLSYNEQVQYSVDKNDEEHHRRMIDSIASLSNRNHREPLSVSSIKTIVRYAKKYH